MDDGVNAMVADGLSSRAKSAMSLLNKVGAFLTWARIQVDRSSSTTTDSGRSSME